MSTDLGRWPANVILTDPLFDGDAEGVVGGGWQEGGGEPARQSDQAASRSYDGFRGYSSGRPPVDQVGAYSRFFLIPKAGNEDREPLVGGPDPAFAATMGSGVGAREHDPADPRAYRRNVHPTVKPTELMRHLVRLVTRPGGTVLDPFLGSGTTLVAAEREGFRGIGIEREAKYVEIARARLLGIQRGMGLDVAAGAPRRRSSRSHWPANRAAHKPTTDPAGFGFTGQADLPERVE